MDVNTTRAAVSPLAFQTPGGEPLPVREGWLALTYADGELVECRLEFAITHDQWETVDSGHLFNLEPAVRGPSFLEHFEPDCDVEIEARLDERALSFLETFAEDVVEAATLLAEASESSELLHTERWYALNVKQQSGPIKAGFSTSWMWPESE